MALSDNPARDPERASCPSTPVYSPAGANRHRQQIEAAAAHFTQRYFGVSHVTLLALFGRWVVVMAFLKKYGLTWVRINHLAKAAVDEEYGTFQKYLRSHDSFWDLVKDLRKNFKFLGEMGCYYWLYVVGEDVPDHERKIHARE